MEGGLRAAVLDTIAVDPADTVDPADPVACSKSAKSDGGLFKNRLWSSQRPAQSQSWPGLAQPEGPSRAQEAKNEQKRGNKLS